MLFLMTPEFPNTIPLTPSRVSWGFTICVKTYFIWRKIRKLSLWIEKNFPILRTTRKWNNWLNWAIHSNDRLTQQKPEIDSTLLTVPNIWSMGRLYFGIDVMVPGNGWYSSDFSSSESNKPNTWRTIRISSCRFSPRFDLSPCDCVTCFYMGVSWLLALYSQQK